METFTKAMLAQRNMGELWSMRQKVIADLQGQAFVIEQREPSAYERSLDEGFEKNLKTLDAVLEERVKGDPFAKYANLTNGSPQLSQRDKEADQWLRSAILEKNPAGFTIQPDGIEQRAAPTFPAGVLSWGQPGLEYEQRDTLKSTATQALPVSVWSQVMLALVEQTPVMRAGCLVITTSTGEDLQVPKMTAFQSGNLIAEGVSITESDPTLAVVTLKSYGYKAFWQLSRELADDTPVDLLGALSRGAGTALALSFGPHLATGTGSGQPLGYITGGTVGVTGPTGTATSFGNQATAGQGSDLVFDLYGSLAEPYLLSPAIATLARNATYGLFRKVKEGTTNKPMFDLTAVKPGASVNLLGLPGYVDPHTPAVAASAKSLAFGDWSRYAVRMVGGIRLERSDEYAFQNDLVSFKAVIRLDGAIVDTTAIKIFLHSAT